MADQSGTSGGYRKYRVLGGLATAELLAMTRRFSVSAVGPLVGTVAMLTLRRLPEAESLAGGRR